ncbi:MAG: GNAT family N-acetyltransferase [Alphaproteobacteria bacterium]|nr:MAG: GNAT family N-acetyltransferase [Alphaproteobacteria bacterium]
MIIIRDANIEQDAHPICKMLQALAYEESVRSFVRPEALIEQTLRGTPRLKVAVAETKEHGARKVVGVAIAYRGFDVLSATPGLHLSDIYVHPEYRKGGVARRLIAHIVQMNPNDPCEWMSWTMLSENKVARGFYQHMGATHLDVDFMAFGASDLTALIRNTEQHQQTYAEE